MNGDTSLTEQVAAGHITSPRKPSRRTSVNSEERDSVAKSIKNANTRRQPVIFDDDEPDTLTDGQHHDREGSSQPTGAGALVFDDPQNGVRCSSPYTQNPPIDFDGLSWPSRGTRARREASKEQSQERQLKIQNAVQTILDCLGEDYEREGLRETPERYAKAMLFFTKGYEENVKDLVNGAVFHEDHDELVIVKDIEIFSMCEHHLVPFTGKMHIGYIPNRRVLGLSKLARLAEMFARRLQIQERLTKQVALAITEVLQPQGVAVVMESTHLCMVMRGVQKSGSTATTSCMLGCMRSSAKTREEFLNLVKR